MWFSAELLTWCSVSVIYLDLLHWVRPQSCPQECSPSWWLSGGQEKRQDLRSCPALSHGRWLWSWAHSRHQKPEDPHSPLWWEVCGRPWPHSLGAEWVKNNWKRKGRVFMLPAAVWEYMRDSLPWQQTAFPRCYRGWCGSQSSVRDLHWL